MGENTKIQWAHHTHNPWVGCSKVSEECRSCYAEVETFPRTQRAAGRELWGPHADRHVTSEANWRKPIAWNRDAEQAGERRRVFCASMSDVFEDRDGEVGAKLALARLRLWNLIEDTPWLDWMLLTKRPEHIRHKIPPQWLREPQPNVWYGTSVGLNKHMDRWLELARVPAAVRFLSCEPLLERVHLVCSLCGRGVHEHGPEFGPCIGHYPDLVIMGGESGRRPRDADIDWYRSLIGECGEARGVAAFMKQAGARPVDGFHRLRLKHPKGGDLDELPADLRVRQLPEARA